VWKWCESRLRQKLTEPKSGLFGSFLLQEGRIFEKSGLKLHCTAVFQFCLANMNRIAAQTNWMHSVMQEMSCDKPSVVQLDIAMQESLTSAPLWWQDFYQRLIKLVRWLTLTKPEQPSQQAAQLHRTLAAHVCVELAWYLHAVSAQQRRQAAILCRGQYRQAAAAASSVALRGGGGSD